MVKHRFIISLSILFLLVSGLLFGQESLDEKTLSIIKRYGVEKSEVMDLAGWMTNIYGPRLTGSPMLDKATDWAQQTLKSWGLQNVHTEAWGPFGQGWELQHFSVHVTEPGYFTVLAYPKAWSPSLPGPAEGEAVFLDVNEEADLDKYKGKLKGKFVLIDTVLQVNEWFEAPADRMDAEELLDLANAPEPSHNVFRNFGGNLQGMTSKLWSFLYEEQPLAIIDRSYKGDLGVVFVSGARSKTGRAYDKGAEILPQMTMSVEHYNRVIRMLQNGQKVRMSMDLKSRYTNADGMEHNIIAEIPGTDLAEEVVMFGAHFDSWHAATGATDNAAGSAVMMEAARILAKTISESGIKPRRTLRLALWTGEEQGLLGSRAYCNEHFAEKDKDGNVTRPNDAGEKISAYYNLDNGTGKIRGVYMQGNALVEPLFRKWLEPFKDMDATTLTLSNTGGTDHLSFDRLNIPGFQFIQDPVAYSTRTHHSNMDNYDHLVEADLKQAATIIAAFVWQTAQRDNKLPRKTPKT